MSPEHPSIWTKVDFDLVGQSPVAATKQPDQAEMEARRRYVRRSRVALDVVACVVWLYAFVEVFFADVSHSTLGHLAGYRFFGFVALAVVIAVIAKKPLRITAAYAYLALWPLVVGFWKIPKVLYRTRSWVAFFGAVNAVTVFVTHVRYTVIWVATALFGALLILVSGSHAVLGVAAVAIAALVFVSIFRVVRASLRRSTFLSLHQRAIRRAVDSEYMKQQISLDAELRSTEVQRFTPAQQQVFVQSLSTAVLIHRGLYFWAYQLDQYRKSAASMLFNAVMVLSLIVQAVLGFALINEAIYKIDPSAFVAAGHPSFAVFVRYSLVGLYGGEIQALQPANDLTNVISIVTVFIGGVIIVTLLTSLVLGYREAKDQAQFDETIASIKQEGQKLDRRLQEEYEVTLAQALTRLADLRAGLLQIITFISRGIPPDFERGE